LFFDITNKETFNNLNDWMNEIKKYKIDSSKMVLIGTKCDLEDQRKITQEEARQFAFENNLIYVETSSKSNINIEESIEYLCADMLSEIYPQIKDFLVSNFQNQVEWKMENHSKFLPKFKENVFYFLLSIKYLEKKTLLKIPKVIRHEIIKKLHLFTDITQILQKIKSQDFFKNQTKKVNTNCNIS
jgi:GTPase SAR1 family protein